MENQFEELNSLMRGLPLPNADTPPDQAVDLTIKYLSTLGELGLGLAPEPGVPSVIAPDRQVKIQ